MWLRWLPHIVTASRGVAGPFVLGLLLTDRGTAAFWLFTVAAFTDLYDGWLARKLDAPGDWGLLLDPLSDKVLWGCSWVGLLLTGWAPWWLAAPILLRDASVAAAWALLRRRGVRWAAAPLGQVATSYEGAALGILLFHGPWLGVHWPSVGVVVGCFGLVLSLASAAWYALHEPPATP